MDSLEITITSYQEHLQGFEAWLRSLGYASSTCDKYPRQLREFLYFLEQQGRFGLAEVGASDVSAYFDYLSGRRSVKTGELLSHSHLRSVRKTLRGFQRYLRSLGVPVFSLPGVSLPGLSAAPIRVLSRVEVGLLYDGCGFDHWGLRDQALLSLGYGCGLRRSEIHLLDVGDVHFKKGWVQVLSGKGRKERFVPMVGRVKDDLYAYLTEGRRFFSGRSPSPAFLLSQRGHRLGPKSLSERLEKLATKAELSGGSVGLHSLRHSIATHLHNGGMSLSKVSLFLGHSSLDSTQLYTHL
ncbi:tyrosine-type recombinase/integrase [Microscilla marina]|uniref:Tyrosine recombinase XerD n=1 Tax=Microscilla marina ATCC 23134 TaxID=313606 RepID=A2A034_MICM2|nr:tyrosine-type recombinase/integrase [Microscilla marina]EAY24009.1 tyrosine recombinase XerD [Microscilla marina ATCC 23134]